MKITEIITILIAFLALIISGISLYYQFFKTEEKVSVVFDEIWPTEDSYAFPITILNSGTEWVAISEISIYFQRVEIEKEKATSEKGIKTGPEGSVNKLWLNFILKPGEIHIEKIKLEKPIELARTLRGPNGKYNKLDSYDVNIEMQISLVNAAGIQYKKMVLIGKIEIRGEDRSSIGIIPGKVELLN